MDIFGISYWEYDGVWDYSGGIENGYFHGITDINIAVLVCNMLYVVDFNESVFSGVYGEVIAKAVARYFNCVWNIVVGYTYYMQEDKSMAWYSMADRNMYFGGRNILLWIFINVF